MSEPNDRPIERGDSQQLPADLQAIQQKLSSLSPRQDRLDRERLAFLAGQATVATSARPRSVLGLNLRHEGWAAGFAAMTAVAATLLALLVTRPLIVEHPPFGADVIADAVPVEPIRSGRFESDVLSTSDLYRQSVDELLARNDTPSIDVTQSSDMQPADSSPRSNLTPASWQRFAEGFESADPSSPHSSNINSYQGLQS